MCALYAAARPACLLLIALCMISISDNTSSAGDLLELPDDESEIEVLDVPEDDADLLPLLLDPEALLEPDMLVPVVEDELLVPEPVEGGAPAAFRTSDILVQNLLFAVKAMQAYGHATANRNVYSKTDVGLYH